jgi:hypothetical protein
VLFPPVNDNLDILFDDGFNDRNLLLLETVVVDLCYRVDIIFGFTIVFDDVNVNRFVVVGVEHEPKTEKYEDSGHIYVAYSVFNAKIGLFFLIAK